MLLNQALVIYSQLITAILTAEEPKNTKIWKQNTTSYPKLENANFLLATQDQKRYYTPEGKDKKEVLEERTWFVFNIYYDLNGKTIEKDSEISIDLLKNPSKYLNANLQVNTMPKHEKLGNKNWTHCKINADSLPIFFKIIEKAADEPGSKNPKNLITFSNKKNLKDFQSKFTAEWKDYEALSLKKESLNKEFSYVNTEFDFNNGDRVSFKLIFGRKRVEGTGKDGETEFKIVDVAGSEVEVEFKNLWSQITGTSDFDEKQTKAIAGYLFPVEVRMHPVVWWILASFTGGLGIFFLISLRKGLK